MRILGISLITNKAAGLGNGGLSHTEVNETANSSEERIIRLVHQILDEWN